MGKLGEKFKCPRCGALDTVDMPVVVNGERILGGCAKCHADDMAEIIEEARKQGKVDKLGRCHHCSSVYERDRLERRYGRATRSGACPLCAVRWGRLYILYKIKE